MFLVEKLGRKVLLITSASGSALSILALGTFFYIQENKCLKNMPNEECNSGFDHELIDSLKWMPVVSAKCQHNRDCCKDFNVSSRHQQCCTSCFS